MCVNTIKHGKLQLNIINYVQIQINKNEMHLNILNIPKYNPGAL